VQISNTLHVGEVLVSEAFAEELASRDDLEVMTEPQEMEFDEHGNLYPVHGQSEPALLASAEA
jgi:hypothetical protein